MLTGPDGILTDSELADYVDFCYRHPGILFPDLLWADFKFYVHPLLGIKGNPKPEKFLMRWKNEKPKDAPDELQAWALRMERLNRKSTPSNDGKEVTTP